MTRSPVAAVAGALGFLSRVPVAHSDARWDAFRRTPAAIPTAGYPIGALLALPIAAVALAPGGIGAAVPTETVAVVFVAWLYALTGITHLDGVADLGDAAVVHGDADRRREVLKDSSLGVGGALALALVVLGLAAAAALVADLARFAPIAAVALVIGTEVAAKAATATLVCVGEAPHEGLGSALTAESGPRSLLGVGIVAAPVALVGWPALAPGIAVLVAAALVAAAALWWARSRLGGVSGDVLGATNEIARVVGLHVGVIAWTLS
ncbi:adenosylcobinamide-GDP ribazoletransferase [Halobaculum sp. WSA2]|uniref:Adenosylcobinamide-GDP ribazoletransferase n=1 Tax=Halobaculum saliterrae TaxID=2073113 RepID=A0A6B0SZV8_9EURY|nr:adenosylcobinamide-GDP ribazoletransferase [Halobaculum saliterrae]MXR41882.1 adenosylcobinamide-GDP ribazoletransferase [Halobaculum saliterrae]